MQTIASEWIEEGRREGEISGRIKTQREMVLQVLLHKFNPHHQDIEQLQQQLAKIDNGATLTKLINLALDVKILPEFVLNLQGFLIEKAMTTSPEPIGRSTD